MTSSDRDIRMTNGSMIQLAGSGEPLQGLERMGALFIRIDEPWTECIACGAECVTAQGIPMYDGLFLEADAPGFWAGFDACRPCFDAYTAGGVRRLMFRLGRIAAIHPENDRARQHYRTWNLFGGPMFTEREIREWAASGD